MTEHVIVHGTSIKIGPLGVIFLGPSGSGKSDLALRMLDQSGSGASEHTLECILISDDQTVLRSDGKRLVASAPEALRGRIEVRGLGIIEVLNRSTQSCGRGRRKRLER